MVFQKIKKITEIGRIEFKLWPVKDSRTVYAIIIHSVHNSKIVVWPLFDNEYITCRYYLMLRAKEAVTVGILVGTLGAGVCVCV